MDQDIEDLLSHCKMCRLATKSPPIRTQSLAEDGSLGHVSIWTMQDYLMDIIIWWSQIATVNV